jgi:linoleoyl-CoA desaturase
MTPDSKGIHSHVRPKYVGREHAGFSSAVRQRVDQYFRDSGLPRRGGREIRTKTVVLFALYVGSYLLLLSNWFTPGGTLLVALAFGALNVLLVFNVAHDAAHNALFDNRRLNRLLTYTFNLVGANAYLWDITHNQIHHAYPNVGDYDGDIHQQAPLIRVSPTVPRRWYHRFQPFYAPLAYMTYSLYLVFVKDYQDIGILPKKGSRLLQGRHHSRWRYLEFLVWKAAYYGLTVVVPFLVLDVTWAQFLVGFLIVHAFMSLLLSVVLVPVHMVDEAPFDTVTDEGTIEEGWFIHVFKNTIDYARRSRLANLLFGGLNTHLVHHLFPSVCHVHYIALSDILEETAGEYDVPYRAVTMPQAVASHFRLLARMGG